VPAPGEAPLPAANAAALLRANATDPARRDRPAVRFGDRLWTHAEYMAESSRFAHLFLDRLPADASRHVAVLLDNTPDYLFAFGGAALAGATVVGLNHTRRGEHLLRDIEHTDCALVITEPRHLPLLEPIAGRLPAVLVSSRFDGPADAMPDGSPGVASVGDDLDGALAGYPPIDPGLDTDLDATWALIFTSGTSAAPKAVICSQRRLMVSGNRLGMLLGITPNDVGYICMPLFHSNAVMVGWAPSIVFGASVGLARRFSASRWLTDVRHYGATYFNYTGKPLGYILATPEHPDDADNPLEVAYGNEGSPQVVAEFARRFDVEVIDAFGATEGGIAVTRTPDQPAGSVGRAGPTVKVVDDDGNELERARVDAHGRLTNSDRCVGEIVNIAGSGPFEGYYNNPEATATSLRNGWYWSGDLGYLDERGFLYFAGRTADWLRVDGENFPAGPIEAALLRHADVMVAAVYGVPDEQAGDQAMAALVLREGAVFDGEEFAKWLDDQDDVGPKWRPRYVRIARELPGTGTNKVVKRALVTQKYRRDRVGDDELWARPRGAGAYRRFTADDERALHAALVTTGRERFWDL
jgi:fatty-acyl-CoA synthase